MPCAHSIDEKAGHPDENRGFDWRTSDRATILANLLLVPGAIVIAGALAIVDGNLDEFRVIGRVLLMMSVLVWLTAGLLGLWHRVWGGMGRLIRGWFRMPSLTAAGQFLWDPWLDGPAVLPRRGPRR